MSGKTNFFRGYANFLGEISFMYQFLFANRKKSFRIEYPLIYLLQLRFPLFYLIIYLLKLSAQKLVSYQSNLNVINLNTDRCPSLPLSLVYLQLNKILCKMKKKTLNYKAGDAWSQIGMQSGKVKLEFSFPQYPDTDLTEIKTHTWLHRKETRAKANPTPFSGQKKQRSFLKKKNNKELSAISCLPCKE